MKTSVIITNYNYAAFVCEAINSCLNQSVPVDEIIVVDDGSKDDSLDVLNKNFSDIDSVSILSQKNGGMLSAMQAGFYQSTGDIVFFLDADDRFKPDHVKSFLKIFADHKEVDFLFCNMVMFDDEEGLYNDRGQTPKHYGLTTVRTLNGQAWIGAPTSAMSMRRQLLERIFPFDHDIMQVCRRNGDTCLIYGASAARGVKYYLPSQTVEYRVHGNNMTFNNERISKLSKLDSDYRKFSLIRYFHERYNLPDLSQFILQEFNQIDKPDETDLNHYQKSINASELPCYRKLLMRLRLKRMYKRLVSEATA